MSVNKVILLGNFGDDPEVRSLPSGDTVINFSLATTDKWTDKDGQKQERTEWHRCSAFGGVADVISEWFHKGSEIYIEGKLQTRKWQDQQGNDRYTTEIRVESFSFTGGSNRDNNDRQQNRNQSRDNDRGRGNNNRNSGTNRQQQQNRGGSARRQADGNSSRNNRGTMRDEPSGGYGGQGGFDEMDEDIPF